MQSYLYDKIKRPYSEEEAKKPFKALMTGLEYMHHNNTCHRDLKLENFLFADDGHPLISDFGFAALALQQNSTVLNTIMRNTPCGTYGVSCPLSMHS